MISFSQFYFKRWISWLGLTVLLTSLVGIPQTVSARSYYATLITGCVYRPDGSLLTDRTFTIRMYNDSYIQSSPLFGGGTWPDDRAGCFRVVYYYAAHLSPGTYYLKFSESSSYSDHLWAPQFFAINIPNMVETQTMDIHLLTPTKFISGKVLDNNGQPMQGSEILVTWNQDSGKHILTDGFNVADDGHYSAAIASSGGSYTLTVENFQRYDFMEVDQNRSIVQPRTIQFSNSAMPENLPADFTLTPVDGKTVISGYMDAMASSGIKPSNRVFFFHDKIAGTWKQVHFDLGSYGPFFEAVAPGTYTVTMNGLGNDFAGQAFPDITVTQGQTFDLGLVYPLFWDDGAVSTDVLPSVNFAVHRYLFTVSEHTDYRDYPLIATGRSKITLTELADIDTSQSKNVSFNAAGVTLIPSQGLVTLTSKAVTPPAAQINTIDHVTAYVATPNDDLRLHYEFSPDGNTWLSCGYCGSFKVPISWDTSQGLRWRVTTSATDGVQPIQIKQVRIYFTAQVPSNGRPILDLVTGKKSGSRIQVTVYGHNFQSGSAVYIGSRRAASIVFINSSKIQFMINKADYATNDYLPVIIVNPKLQTFQKKWNPVTLKMYRPVF